MKVYGIQFGPVWEDQPANCRRIAELLTIAAPEAGSLVVLPEMCVSGFTMNASAAASTATTVERLSGLARQHGVHLVAGLARGGPAANEAVVFGPDGDEACRYRKQRPFTFGGEAEVYQAGGRFEMFDWQGARVAPFICYDLRFPELFRPAAAAGMELLVVIASWPKRRIEHWVKLLQARAIENQCHVIGVNRTGSDPVNEHNGRSMIVNAMGELVVDAGEAEGVICAEIDFEAQRDLRVRLPFLRDMV